MNKIATVAFDASYYKQLNPGSEGAIMQNRTFPELSHDFRENKTGFYI